MVLVQSIGRKKSLLIFFIYNMHLIVKLTFILSYVVLLDHNLFV